MVDESLLGEAHPSPQRHIINPSPLSNITRMNPPPPQRQVPSLVVRPSASSISSLLPADQLPFTAPRITFRHPGHPDSDNVLFSLSPIDSGGVDHGTAQTACLIFACNIKGCFRPLVVIPPTLFNECLMTSSPSRTTTL